MLLNSLYKLIGDKEVARIIAGFIIALGMIALLVVVGGLLFN